MKRLLYISLFLPLTFFSCETEINPSLRETDPVLNVDAWLTHTRRMQTVRLTYTRPYFDNTEAEGAEGAEVFIVDQDGARFDFVDTGDGFYSYEPASDTFGIMGHSYFFQANLNGVEYYSFSQLNPVPTIDSITWRYEEEVPGFIDEYYAGEFWARDILGEGNTYWIKAWKNGQYLNKPSEINIAYDAGFSAGGVVDGLIFIQPIRDLITPFDEIEDENAEFQFEIPFVLGDAVSVEIHSVSPEAWFFLANVIEQTNRQGGFGELFATPLANVSTNITTDTEGVDAVGFFNVAAVSAMSRQFTEEAIRVDKPL